jgi:hypothetical protein
VAYELFYIDDKRDLHPRGDLLQPDLLAFQSRALQGAIASSPLSQARNGKSALAPAAVQVVQEAYAVVNASDLRLADADAQATSIHSGGSRNGYTEAGAQRLMEGLIHSNPALEGEILVVPVFEVNRL